MVMGGFSGFFMVPGGFLMVPGWFLMVPGRFSWFFMVPGWVFHGSRLVFPSSRSGFMVIHGFRLVLMVPGRFSWFQVGFSFVTL